VQEVVEPRVREPRRVTHGFPHALELSQVRAGLRAREDVRRAVVQELLGHADVRTTMIYTIDRLRGSAHLCSALVRSCN
jgi:integrase